MKKYSVLAVLALSLVAMNSLFDRAEAACRKCARPEWSGGNCWEVSDGGILIRTLPNSVCRRAVGSYFDWDDDGQCSEYTPDGDFIAYGHHDNCAMDCGVIRRR